MPRVIKFTALLLLVLLLFQPAALADGMMVGGYNSADLHRQDVVINEAEQKAVIFFRNGMEDLIISPSFDGAPERFAWVVPVPTKPKVEVVKGAIFHELKRLTSGWGYRDGVPMIAKAATPPVRYPKPEVRVLERRVLGKYDVAVLSSTDGKAGAWQISGIRLLFVLPLVSWLFYRSAVQTGDGLSLQFLCSSTSSQTASICRHHTVYRRFLHSHCL